ncbi:HAMP domain-containing sensor histidine kinase [Pseudolysinimonas sp.]|uniref:sensor histidine kinase n=1 Tax=Pseudolysinimonas sp. TaxID=2680009 RepID=UPI00286AD169|nr:HAMP domain-containing sensor histidine kinase [Pseudolysinimonas sp.]
MSVRSRITLLATAVVVFVLVLTATSLVASQRVVLTDNVDEVLQRHVAEIAQEIAAGTLPTTIPGQGDDEAFAYVVDANGEVVASTTRSIDHRPIDAPTDETPQFQTVRPVSGVTNYRVISQRSGALVIVAGTPLDDVDESVATLATGLAVAVPAASLLLAFLVWFLVGRVLRPVEEIRTQVAAIGSGSLDRRVPEPRTLDEVGLLARTMNQMLARLEASSERQRRFVADASHELRSPLARIRAELEVDRAHPDSADPAATSRSVLEEVDILQGLVDDLLTLARSDGAASQSRPGLVDLDDVVLGEVDRLGGARGAVDISGVSGAQVLGDPIQLSRVVRNLLDNALRHGGLGITVTLREQDGDAVLAVADDGRGIPAEDRERVFERFARIDEARAASDGGAGLGLAIVRGIATAHGGTVVVDPTFSPGARFVVRIPLAKSGWADPGAVP